MCPGFAFQCPCRSSSPGLTGRSSIPETAVKESRGRGVLGPGSRPGRQRMCGRELAKLSLIQFPEGLSSTSSWRRPGPIITDVFDERDWSSDTAPQLTFVGMGPGLRRDDTEYVAAISAQAIEIPSDQWAHLGILAARMPEVWTLSLSMRGSRECRVRAAPAVSRARLHKRKRTRAYRFSGGSPAFPAQWLYGLCRALLGDEFVLSPSSADSD